MFLWLFFSALITNNPDFYTKQIRIGGTFNSNGLSLQLSQGTAGFNPNTYFAFRTAPNTFTGIYIRLIQPVDRDVCISYHFDLLKYTIKLNWTKVHLRFSDKHDLKKSDITVKKKNKCYFRLDYVFCRFQANLLQSVLSLIRLAYNPYVEMKGHALNSFQQPLN
jgi:hypothetical protein